MNYSFHPEAEAEFLGAFDFYEEHKENLGLDFAECSIHRNPMASSSLR